MLAIRDDGFDLHADQRGRIMGSMVFIIVFTIITVALRFLSRRLARAGLWWDDWLCLAAMIVSLMCPAIMLYELRNGFGRHITSYPDPSEQIEKTAAWLKSFWFFQWIFHTATTIAKFAVLAFYYRIFPLPKFRRLLLWVGGLCVLHITTIDLAIIFQCTPIHHSWDQVRPDSKGRCFHQIDFFIASGSANAALNLLLFVLPIPILRRLRTTARQQIVLVALFTLAGFTVLVSVIWIIVISNVYEKDVTWNFIDTVIWSVLEPTMAVVCACIPSLRPLTTALSRGFASLPSTPSPFHSTLTTKSSARRTWGSSVKASNGEFSQLDEEGHDLRPLGHDARVDARRIGKGDDGEEGAEVPPSRGINVKTEVMVGTETRLDYNDRLF